METYIINGGVPLHGRVQVGGSKNAALPLLYATLLTEGVTVIRRLPDIGDVRVTLQILRELGARVLPVPDGVSVDTAGLTYTPPRPELVGCIRASTYLIGSLLSRFGRCRLGCYGGCNFSNRPIDMHLAAARALGAREQEGELLAERLTGGEICLPFRSVGATVNSLLLAARAEGTTVIRAPATEPHILSLVAFLNSVGADIRYGGDAFTVRGVPRLRGGEVTVIPDMIEAGTYAVAGLLTGGEVTVEGFRVRDLAALWSVLSAMGARVEAGEEQVCVTGGRLGPAVIETAPFPGFPTDMQPLIAPLLAANSGGVIREGVWRDRFGYLGQLGGFGVRYARRDGEATLFPSSLHASGAEAVDLRGGAACILAALAAPGESGVGGAGNVTRGYSDLIRKMGALGAHIRSVC